MQYKGMTLNHQKRVLAFIARKTVLIVIIIIVICICPHCNKTVVAITKPTPHAVLGIF